MSMNKRASLALTVGTVAGLVTMAFHPSGHLRPSDVTDALVVRDIAVHALAISAMPLMLLGTLAITLRFEAERDFAIGAYVFFALGTVAMMSAAIASGFIASHLMRDLTEKPEAQDAIIKAVGYTAIINRSYAKVGTGLETAGIAIWSWTMLRTKVFPRSLAIYGLVYAVVVLALLLGGFLPLNVHDFGLIVLGQAVWIIWAAIELRREGAGV